MKNFNLGPLGALLIAIAVTLLNYFGGFATYEWIDIPFSYEGIMQVLLYFIAGVLLIYSLVTFWQTKRNKDRNDSIK